MIIIVEGIDRVGKTTLCNMINEKLKIESFKREKYLKLSEMDNDNETDKMIQLLNIANSFNLNIVFDRLYFSDYVYGTIERKYEKKNAERNFNVIDRYASELNDIVFIYVIPIDINRSSREHGKDLSEYDELFKELYDKSKIKNKYRCTYDSLSMALKYLEEKYNAI